MSCSLPLHWSLEVCLAPLPLPWGLSLGEESYWLNVCFCFSWVRANMYTLGWVAVLECEGSAYTVYTEGLSPLYAPCRKLLKLGSVRGTEQNDWQFTGAHLFRLLPCPTVVGCEEGMYPPIWWSASIAVAAAGLSKRGSSFFFFFF